MDTRTLAQPPKPCEYTFYTDFQIAERFGHEAIKDTYKRVLKEWIDNPAAWGEVVCALNWRLWDLYETDEPTARLYERLWMEAYDLGWKNAEKRGDEYADIFFEKTD